MDLSEHVARARAEGAIDGLAVATLAAGELSQGLAGRVGASAVTAQTGFRAASLSKPVFAYMVLRLIDQGVLSLDTRLGELAAYAPGDALAAGITVAHALGHATGFPNWRSAEQPLKSYFRPGERFSYSGEGFAFLQQAVERLTGEPLEATARRLVFEPLAMTRSTFDPALRSGGGAGAAANAAHSLRTTAADYARFLGAALAGTGLRPATSDAWMRPCRLVPANFVDISDPRAPHQTDPAVAWGLGWGLETQRGCFFQWGANNGYVSFAIGSRAEQAAFVMLTTGFTGLDCLRRLVELALPGPRPSLDWIGRRTPLRP